MNRITSGGRICLVYDVFHNDDVPRPTLVTTHPAVRALGDVIRSWSISDNRAIFYLLDGTYDNFASTQLEGKDRQVVEALELLFKEQGGEPCMGLTTAVVDIRDPASCADGPAKPEAKLTKMYNLDGEVLLEAIVIDGILDGQIPISLFDRVAESVPEQENADPEAKSTAQRKCGGARIDCMAND